MNYPEIRFRHSWLLIGAIYNDIKPAYESPKNKLHPLDSDFIAETMQRYEKAWRPYEETIIHGMCKTLNLEFRQNIIDVYVAPFSHSFSDPMFIATKFSDERVITELTHEIIHRLLTDNLQSSVDTDYVQEWQKLFGKDHSVKTLVRIPVHATIQAVFDDELHEPERTRSDIAHCQQYEDYKSAWQYVEKVGYKTVIAQLKESYAELK